MEKRYVTRGINEILPLETQFSIWNMVDHLNAKGNMDYFQVFKLRKDESGQQEIMHIQEVPEYEKTISIDASLVLTDTIYVIRDKDKEGKNYYTMLFAREY